MFKIGLQLIVFGFFCIKSLAQENQNYVILISLDGFRYDYVDRFQPENLSRFIASGTSAKSMISSFPTKTFPSHYAVATGMRPEKNGLVNNSFYDPDKGQVYSIGNKAVVHDPYWYAGTPLWVQAEQHGVKAASFFFVGSETAIKGTLPSFYYVYDGNVPNLTRTSKVLEWLQLPEQERPRFITMYFSDMDDVGHMYGPDNDAQLSKKLQKLDRELGSLFEGLKSLNLPINVVIVSDHGMANVPIQNLVDLDQMTKGLAGKVVNNGSQAHVYLEDPSTIDTVLAQLRSFPFPVTVDKVCDKTFYKHTDQFGKRMGDILIMADLGYYLATASDMVKYQQRAARFDTRIFGEHGYSPEYKEMHGIFYANGPRIRQGHQIETFENVHVYPLICQILGIPIPADIDGSKEVLQPILKEKVK
jgi:predicted AlkP superfamily pyrophosphatase or phosphodiesterase